MPNFPTESERRQSIIVAQNQKRPVEYTIQTYELLHIKLRWNTRLRIGIQLSLQLNLFLKIQNSNGIDSVQKSPVNECVNFNHITRLQLLNRRQKESGIESDIELWSKAKWRRGIKLVETRYRYERAIWLLGFGVVPSEKIEKSAWKGSTYL